MAKAFLFSHSSFKITLSFIKDNEKCLQFVNHYFFPAYFKIAEKYEKKFQSDIKHNSISYVHIYLLEGGGGRSGRVSLE